MPDAVALLSAGLDSTANLKCATDRGGRVLAFTVDYGQRAARREVACAAAMAARLGCPHRVIALPWLAEGSRSALFSHGGPVPTPADADLDDAQGAAARSADAVWVPNRNGVLLNVAAAVAEQTGATEVVVGFNAEEGATFPDNTPAFLDAVNRAFAFSTRGAVRARCDTLHMTKAEIVRLGLQIAAPLDLAWPCYHGGEALCGRCESCLRFLRAIRQAGAEEWFRANHPGVAALQRGKEAR